MWASLVRLLHFVAIRAFAQRRLGQMIVRPARAGPPLGMSPFRIWHRPAPSLSKGTSLRISAP
jgi:hypothetical protein